MSIQAAAKYTHARWKAVAGKAQKKPETRLFIDGWWAGKPCERGSPEMSDDRSRSPWWRTTPSRP